MAAKETLAGRKILVIDDNPVIQRALYFTLKACGYEVTAALSGPDAIACLHHNKPDLILLDIMFPADPEQGSTIWDGFNILSWLQRMGHAGDIPCIIISGANPERYRERCFKAGVKGYFSKPLPIQDLMDAIRAVLTQPATHDAGDQEDGMKDLHMSGE
jgi:CheY-like chemotaxis protein